MHDDEPIEHDGGVELLIRKAQQLRTDVSAEAEAGYRRELTYRAALLTEPARFSELRDVVDRLVREVAQARDAEHEARAERRGLVP